MADGANLAKQESGGPIDSDDQSETDDSADQSGTDVHEELPQGGSPPERNSNGRKVQDTSPEAAARRAKQRARYAARQEKKRTPQMGATSARLTAAAPNRRPHPLPPAVDPVRVEVNRESHVVHESVAESHQRLNYAATADVCVTSYFFVGAILFGNEFAPKLPEEKQDIRELGDAFRNYLQARGSTIDVPPEVVLAVALMGFTYRRVAAKATMMEKAKVLFGRVFGGLFKKRTSNLYAKP